MWCLLYYSLNCSIDLKQVGKKKKRLSEGGKTKQNKKTGFLKKNEIQTDIRLLIINNRC